MSRVFVYGILLADATVAARLDDWRLAFSEGLATIERADGAHVDGGLVEVDDAGLRRYDAIEGVDHGLYWRGEFRVKRADGEVVPAWTYVKTAPGDPWVRTDMIATIHRAYLRLGLNDAGLVDAVGRVRYR